MKLSARCGHKMRQKRGSGKQFIVLLCPRDRRQGSHAGPHGEAPGSEDRNEGVLIPRPLLKFPWERRGREW